MLITGIIMDMAVELPTILDMLIAMLAVPFMGILPMAAITMERERLMPNLKLILTLDMPTLMDTHILMGILMYWVILILLDIPIPLDTLMVLGTPTPLDTHIPLGTPTPLDTPIPLGTPIPLDTPIPLGTPIP